MSLNTGRYWYGTKRTRPEFNEYSDEADGEDNCTELSNAESSPAVSSFRLSSVSSSASSWLS